MKSLFSFSLVFITALVMSCSGDEGAGPTNSNPNNGGGSGQENPTSITLSTTVQSFNNTTPVGFIVKDNFDNSVTNQSTLTANGETITNPHLFETPGTYNIVATYNDLTSNTLEILVEDNPPTSIVLFFDRESYMIDEEGVFSVKDNFNNIVTSDAEVTVNGNPVNTNPYLFDQAGTFEFIATYEGLTSNTVSFEILDPSEYSDTSSFDSSGAPSSFTKKVLLEDFTGTWCPNCPPAAAAVESTVNGSTIFGVGYHWGVSTYPDPMEIPETNFWTNHYNVTGFPTVYVNGPDTRWNFPNMTQVNNELAEEASVGLAVEAALVGGKLDLEVKVGFKTTPSEEVKLMIYLIEGSATSSSPQAGSTQGTSYVHKDILREVYTDQLGDVIPASSTAAGGVFTRTITGLDLPSNTSDYNDLKVVAYVRNTYTKTFVDYFNETHVDSPHYDIYNVQEVHVGESAPFD